MSFQTGLSGLNASSRSLDVIGNNIANANTTGMKASRAEFSDLVASSFGASSSASAGLGVMVAAVSQQFNQGSITTTGNNLDVAINGLGFFQLEQPNGTQAYTRDGSFKLDNDGWLKTNGNAYVIGTDASGIKGSKLQLSTVDLLSPTPTTIINAGFNLDARAQPAATSTPPTPRSTYSISSNVYNATGVPLPVSFYFEKDASANTWNIYAGIDGIPNVGDTYPILGTLSFDSSGKNPTVVPNGSLSPPPTAFGTSGLTLPAGTSGLPYPTQPITIDFDTALTTQYGTAFRTARLEQDGYPSGDLTGLSIGDTGQISANYSNGRTQNMGQLELADFRNVQGLMPLGGNAWSETLASGKMPNGAPGTNRFGTLKSGALEDSNVDLTSELVNMMTAQRAYQANAQTIKTQDQVMSTLVNLR
jgi:flagellar hook protein FlgE